tara:strand:+ start:101 stop:457 length:357 start_codon:yes stop_codon:yes gene_type:complete
MKKISTFLLILSIFSSCSKSDSEPALSNPYTITTSGLNFEPPVLNCNVGDTIFFELGSSHNAVEVSEDNYNADSPTPLENGFQFGFGASSYFVASEVKTHYYVCVPHLPQMKGRIIVE